MSRDCLPPHARSLPLVDEPARCTPCQKEIESLRGLLAAVRADRAELRALAVALMLELEARP